MCAVSMIGDEYSRKWDRIDPIYFQGPGVTRSEFDALKKEVEALKELLKAAKRFDDETGQPDCEMDEKIAILRKVAEAVGVDLDDVFGARQ